MIGVHRFPDTKSAYDHCQWDDNIKDGAVLVIPSEGVVGILVAAWPVAVTKEHGSFHTLKDGLTWDQFERGKYFESWRHAQVYITQ